MKNGNYYILDGDGNPVVEPDVIKWAKCFNEDDRVVIKTKVGEREVSTVFLGLDHQYGFGPPLLYETMVFGVPEDEEIQERYTTRDEALAGHTRIVEQLRHENWWRRLRRWWIRDGRPRV